MEGPLHLVDRGRITHQRKLIASIRNSDWFQKITTFDKLCPSTWKVTRPVHNRFPRRIVEAKCKGKKVCKFCKPLYYNLLVQFTENDKRTWKIHRVAVAFGRDL